MLFRPAGIIAHLGGKWNTAFTAQNFLSSLLRVQSTQSRNPIIRYEPSHRLHTRHPPKCMHWTQQEVLQLQFIEGKDKSSPRLARHRTGRTNCVAVRVGLESQIEVEVGEWGHKKLGDWKIQ